MLTHWPCLEHVIADGGHCVILLREFIVGTRYTFKNSFFEFIRKINKYFLKIINQKSILGTSIFNIFGKRSHQTLQSYVKFLF